MDIRYLNTFVAVVESGSFSRAANTLNLTQSAVSQRIKFMEEQYGVSLIDRSSAVIVATEAGNEVLRKARQILKLENELKEELKSLAVKSRITLCCTPTFGIVYLPQVLNLFFQTISDEVNFKSVLNTPEEALKGVLGNEFDMAVIEHCSKLETQNAVAFSLPPDELVIVSAPSLGLIRRELSLTELIAQRLIARREGCSSRCRLQENLAKFGKKMDDFHGVVVHNDLYLTIKSVQAGQGVAFVSRTLVREQLKKGELMEHSVEGFQCSRPRTIIINPRRSEERVVKEFIERVLETFETATVSPLSLNEKAHK